MGMTDHDTPRRPGKPRPDSRDERLRAALRANLARRKAQSRARDEDGDTNQTGGTSDRPGKSEE